MYHDHLRINRHRFTTRHQRMGWNRSCISSEIRYLQEKTRHLHGKSREIMASAQFHSGQYNNWLTRKFLIPNHENLAKADRVHKNTIIPYSKAWSLSFADQLRTRLPRELRDMVYNWLWDEEAKDKYWDQLNKAVYNPKPCGHTPCDCEISPYKNFPHFLQPAYMGQTTALETNETI
jgi:hypothetical protein